MKKYWRRFAAWVIALRHRPFLSARIKLTGFYILNTAIVLGIFLITQRYFRLQLLQDGLAGRLAPGIDAGALVNSLSNEMEISSSILVAFVLLAMAILSYFLVRLALQPLRNFIETQRRFISDASHELRTPLATVKTENEVALLDTGRVTRDEAIALLQSNLEEVNRIATILNNLLNLASFNSATGAPPLSAVDLVAITKAIIGKMKMPATRKNIKVVGPEPAEVLVWGNATALEEVVTNLLKNAIQYTPENGEVYLEVRKNAKGKRGELTVKDNGVGIEAKELPYVFEPFYRSDKSLDMHKKGNGLGLPLVREIVKRHRGSIDIKSESGKGTLVTVRIPLAPASQP